MSIGFPAGKAEIDSRAGQLAVDLRDNLRNIEAFHDWLDRRGDDDLTEAGYSDEDIALLRASFADLSALAKLARAQGTLPQANDFWFNAGHLLGVS